MTQEKKSLYLNDTHSSSGRRVSRYEYRGSEQLEYSKVSFGNQYLNAKNPARLRDSAVDNRRPFDLLQRYFIKEFI